MPYVAERDTPLGRWAKALMARAHRNVAVVAFANKLARIAWAVLRREKPFAATGIPAAGSVRRSDAKRRSPTDVCERVTARWPDSRTALRKPGLKNGVCRRGLYSDWSARISIWAGRSTFEAGYVEAD